MKTEIPTAKAGKLHGVQLCVISLCLVCERIPLTQKAGISVMIMSLHFDTFVSSGVPIWQTRTSRCLNLLPLLKGYSHSFLGAGGIGVWARFSLSKGDTQSKFVLLTTCKNIWLFLTIRTSKMAWRVLYFFRY